MCLGLPLDCGILAGGDGEETSFCGLDAMGSDAMNQVRSFNSE